jgi:hypothetical protein
VVMRSLNLIACILIVSVTTCARANYILTELRGTESFSVSGAGYLNSHGISAGSISNGTVTKPAVWSRSGDLQTLSDESGFVCGLSDSGDALVTFQDRLVLYSTNGTQTLISIEGTGILSSAHMNESGDIVYTTSDNKIFVWSMGSGSSFVGQMNSVVAPGARASGGMIIGDYQSNVGSQSTAFAFTTSGLVTLSDFNIFDVSQTGRIVGYGEFRGGGYWRPGIGFVQMPALQGKVVIPKATNNHDMIVGNTVDLVSGQVRGFVYDEVNGYLDFGALAESSQPTDSFYLQEVNDDGQIIGTRFRNGSRTEFLARPVPEPASLIGLGIAMLAMIRREFRARKR